MQCGLYCVGVADVTLVGESPALVVARVSGVVVLLQVCVVGTAVETATSPPPNPSLSVPPSLYTSIASLPPLLPLSLGPGRDPLALGLGATSSCVPTPRFSSAALSTSSTIFLQRSFTLSTPPARSSTPGYTRAVSRSATST
ncbi:hypothetical protein FIBSPDRAFT_942752 [Athelia psychrophila]|uniref:Uncharacterized protein n=1 Tax=Athelia psychrophila TaxID=1759441 RepID=A0A166XCX4_9AGAM|nr:hypothetical protein FIBSPDRAFT_942752 [Fibularhizoctonia sp. CBS 109695]